MSAQCSAAADSAAAAAGVVLLLGVARMGTVASLTDAPLPCQVQLYFWARLEPTRMRWKCDQLRTTSLRTTEASVHKCNGDKSVHDLTLPLSLGLLCAQADSGTHRC